MKLKRLEKNKYKKILLLVIFGIVFLVIGIFIDKTFSLYQVNKSFEFVNGKVNYYGHSDVYFAYYNGSTWLDDIPKKNNTDNLTFEKAICDNDATIEWNYEEWTPKVKNLTKAKTRCSLYFKKDEMNNISTCGKGGTNAATCIKNEASKDTNNLANDNTSDKNIRYIGARPNNYVRFNNELWRIIGVMNNIKTSESDVGESRLKIIKAESTIGIQWDSKNSNDWATSTLKEVLQQRSEVNSPLIDNVVWNLGGIDNALNTAINFYTAERGTLHYGNNATTWIGKVGLMYPSDYGYAVGGSVRNNCLAMNLNSYNTNNCYLNDWLYNNSYQWTITSFSQTDKSVIYVDKAGYSQPSSDTTLLSRKHDVVYLKSSVKIISGNGSSSSPYNISL